MAGEMQLIATGVVGAAVGVTLVGRYFAFVLFDGFPTQTVWSLSDPVLILFILLSVLFVVTRSNSIIPAIVILFVMSNVYLRVSSKHAPVTIDLHVNVVPVTTMTMSYPDSLEGDFKGELAAMTIADRRFLTPLTHVACRWRRDPNLCRFIPLKWLDKALGF